MIFILNFDSQFFYNRGTMNKEIVINDVDWKF